MSVLAGIEYEILDNEDGRLEADLATRLRVIGVIRPFKPALIRVPDVCPLVPQLTYNSVILYMGDRFQKPIPFAPDGVTIDDVLADKDPMPHSHESQFYEWLPWIGGYADQIPDGDEARLAARAEGKVQR